MVSFLPGALAEKEPVAHTTRKTPAAPCAPTRRRKHAQDITDWDITEWSQMAQPPCPSRRIRSAQDESPNPTNDYALDSPDVKARFLV